MEFWSRVRHRGVKAVEVVRGGGIAGGDVIVVEEDKEGRLMGFNRYRLSTRISRIIVEGEWPCEGDERRVLFEPIDGRYPDVTLVFCPSCEETTLVIRVEGGAGGQERPADSSQVRPA
ncbi:hypothetical protein Pyrfu_0605 [Pyrolobus fumarii 1A]|uniref:Uncharacterized protein n=2 Tax=Pyrolobus fumarii TaxID=54252 RepID=G0EH24_PYRF1|nr:hypothetical protein Pyrfu_0605 [Pyrolobus fumarii 1A]